MGVKYFEFVGFINLELKRGLTADYKLQRPLKNQ